MANIDNEIISICNVESLKYLNDVGRTNLRLLLMTCECSPFKHSGGKDHYSNKDAVYMSFWCV